jgi:hypothetical protein
MPMIVSCNGCQKRIQLPDQFQGKAVRCPTCQQVVPVSSATAPMPNKPAAPAPAPKPPTPPAGPTITFKCRACQKSLRVPQARAGSTIKCPGCGQATAVPAADQQAQPKQAPPPDPAAPLDASLLSEDERQRLDAVLTPGERLLWVGRPDPTLAFRKGLLIMGGWMFAALFMGGGAGLIFYIMTQDGKAVPLMGVLLLASLGGLAVLSLIFAIIYPFHSRWRFRGTFYAITTERALVFAVNPIGLRRTETYRPADLQQLQRKDIGSGGAADLIFRIKEIKIHTPGGYDAGTAGRNAVGQRTITKKWQSGGTYRIELHYGFLNLRDADAVEKILGETLLK